VPIFLKSGSLDLLEPSGPVKACSGIALPLLYHTINIVGYMVITLVGFINSDKYVEKRGEYFYEETLPTS
jgi:hypothetical protein